MLKQQIDQDLKAALLAGDKTRVTMLRGLKSVILYAEVAQGAREKGLNDEEILALFAKEVKKRQESADLYRQGGDNGRAQAELGEKTLIESYLPKQLTDEELAGVVDDVITETGAVGMPGMGQVIGKVKQKVANQAAGARIAQLVKERFEKQ